MADLISLNRSILTPTETKQLGVRMNELTDRALARFRQAVRAVYKVDDRNLPDHEGSCILLDIYGVKVLLTAAHIVDVNVDQDRTLCITGEKDLVELDKLQFGLSPKIKGSRVGDHFDFAFARIPPALEARLGQGYVTEGDIMDPRLDITGHLFTTIGYPNSKNDDFDHVNRTVNTHVFPYSSTARSNALLRKKVGEDGVHHLFVGYDKYSRGQDGRKVTSIKPRGLSGGALIDAGRMSNPGVFWGKIDPVPRVAGMIVELWRDHKVLVSTRMWPIVQKAIEELNISVPPGC
ncbi:hypothetical protein QO012_004552 [Methylobacterium aerolatum]|uniref:Trypsin-like peptidase domain-containing protein n=2 Tax=Methylobacterium aerolatum TaxID=418708 RepID=A0ABU0I7G2_9HYPH|nr:hypothetical protein [Methylobacterium aerolatum]